MSSSNASRPRSRPRSPRTWRHITSSSDEAMRGSWRLRWPWPISWRRSLPSAAAVELDHVVAPEDAELLGRPGRLLARRTTHQLGHPAGALDRRDRRQVVPGRAQPADDLAQRPQRHRGLAERRQDPLDVAHEDARGADDEDAAGLVAAAVGVEQVRRAVQRHDRLAGAGATADRDDALGRARGSRGPARPGWWRRSSASTGRGHATAGPSARPRRRSAGRSRPRRRAARPRRRRPAGPRSAARAGVRRRGARRPSPGRRPRPPAPASRSAGSRGRRRAARSGRCSAARGRALGSRSSRPNTRPSWAASSWAIRRAAWKTIASRSTRPPSCPSAPRPWPSRASAWALRADLSSWTYTRSTKACSAASSAASTSSANETISPRVPVRTRAGSDEQQVDYRIGCVRRPPRRIIEDR